MRTIEADNTEAVSSGGLGNYKEVFMKYFYKFAACMTAVLCVLAFSTGACRSGTFPSVPTVTSTTLKKLLTTGPFSIVFSTNMDRTSVESAFTVTGSGAVTGTFTWADDANVTFTPSSRWKTHHQYALTIGTEAKDAKGNSLQTAYTETFRPKLNMHDVNGDGIDDFMLGAPGTSGPPVVEGHAYLFLGKTSWSDVDLASQSADATYNLATPASGFGIVARVVGDINGDGYADMVMTNPNADVGSSTHNGFMVLVYGSATPTSIAFSETTPNLAAFYGPENDSRLGLAVTPLGDINGDGLVDFMVGGNLPPSDSRFWLFLGRETRMTGFVPATNFSNAVYSIYKETLWGEGCDVNGDELDDMVFSSPSSNGGGTERGQMYVVAGSQSPVGMDLRTGTANETINGPSDNMRLGNVIFGCGDINGDGYADLLANSFAFDGSRGEVFLVPGAAGFTTTIDLSSGAPSAVYSGAAATDTFGAAVCGVGDVNNDGFGDFVSTSPFKNSNQGYAYLFLGSATPFSVDLSTGGAAGATYIGKPASFLFACQGPGDINGDGIDDLLLGAPVANGAGNKRGEVYVIFGSASPQGLDLGSQKPGATITGGHDNDLLSVTITP